MFTYQLFVSTLGICRGKVHQIDSAVAERAPFSAIILGDLCILWLSLSTEGGREALVIVKYISG